MARAANGTENLVRTGIPGFDDILGGGFPGKRLFLVDGIPGAGKTTFALQFLLEGVRQGESALYVTLSETKDELHSVARSHDWNLDGIKICELIPAEEDLLPDSQPRMFHLSDVELAETTQAILKEVEAHRPQRVVFDSLSEMRLLAHNSLRYRRQILALKQFFAGRDCTVLLLDDHPSDASDIQLHSLVHGVVALEHLSHDYGGARRRLRVTKMRGTDFRSGYHDFLIRRGGLDVFPRLIAGEHHHQPATQVMQSGVPALDALLGGGLDRGTSVLLMGPAGTGKSSIAIQYAVTATQRGERVAVFAFDENEHTLLRRSAGLGMPLESIIEQGLLTVQRVDPAELSPGEFVHEVRSAVATGARIVVIDSLNGYLNAMPDERHLVLQLHELLTFLNQQGVVTFLVVAQHGLVGSGMGSPVDTSYLADTVIMLRYFEAVGRLRRAISVVKKRSGRHEDTLREFSLSSRGIEISDPIKEFQGVLAGVPTFVKPHAS